METRLNKVRAPVGTNPNPGEKEPRRKAAADNKGQKSPPELREEDFSILILYNSQGQLVKKY
ncbi:MAG: hypothetical protein ACLFSY_08000 [Desulfonatronovibrionaceae bacterium]